MDNTIGLIAAIVSAVVIIGLMATYVQIMNRLIDLKHKLREKEKKGEKTQQEISGPLGEISYNLKWLTWQGLLFFAAVFLLLIITEVLIIQTLKDSFVKYTSIVVIIILFFSQIIHAKVFWKSYKKYICSD